jgi:hypothetical protein
MSVAFVPTHRALSLTYDRVIDVLQAKLPSTLNAQFNRNANNFVDSGSGVYLPDPSEYYRQSTPEREDIKGVTEVEVYTGQRGDTSSEDYANVDGGRLIEVDIPWAVTLIFGVGLQPSIDDPVQSRDLDPREVTQRRANHYSGAIKHTISEFGSIGSGSATRANAIHSTTEGGDLSTTLNVSVNDSNDDTSLRGLALYEFTIHQRQKLPASNQT